jgi:hypothetical protein
VLIIFFSFYISLNTQKKIYTDKLKPITISQKDIFVKIFSKIRTDLSRACHPQLSKKHQKKTLV